MAVKMSDTSANTEADALAALMNAGKLRFYDGARPANANVAVTTQVKLAELTFANPAFAASAAGVITANAITGANALATGTATWFRVVKSDGVTVVMDGDVGTAGSDLNLNSTAIQINAAVSVTSFVHTVTE